MTSPRFPSRYARKRFGQNFLEPAWVTKVVNAIAPKADETFIEIGPGRGALTRPLASRSKAVLAFEIDRDLAGELEASASANLSVIQGDFIESTDAHHALVALGRTTPVRVAGNLPYNVATPILFKLAGLYRAGCPLLDATVMLQREVGDRLIAAPGGREYGVLSVLLQHTALVQRLLSLPPGAFRPRPTVHSVLVRLTFRAPSPPVVDYPTFTALVRAVFTRRRKTLANALLAFEPTSTGRRILSPADVLGRSGLDGTRRPETVSVAEFARLSDIYASISN